MKMDLTNLADRLDVNDKRKREESGIRNYAEMSGLSIWI